MFCLTVCAVPASAVDVNAGVISSGPLMYLSTSANGSSLFSGFTQLNGSQNVSVNDKGNLVYERLTSAYTNSSFSSGQTLYCNYYRNTYLEYIFTVGEGTISFSNAYIAGPRMFYSDSSSGKLGRNTFSTISLNWSFYVDDNLISTYSNSYLPEGTFSYDGDIKDSFRIRAAIPSTATYKSFPYDSSRPYFFGLLEMFLTEYVFNEKPVYADNFEIIIGQLDELNGTVNVISQNVIDLKNEVVAINTALDTVNNTLNVMNNTLGDVSNQLQDSNSNIWTAAKETIGGALEEAFVPSQEDLEELNQQATDLAKDKLGGAYTAMDEVTGAVTQLKDKLNNVTPSEGIEFPGIGLPGGIIEGQGEIILAEKQMVTLPPKLTAILHPVAGTIVSIVVGLATFRVMADMVECFFSGYSYSQFLHRDKGGGDDD